MRLILLFFVSYVCSVDELSDVYEDNQLNPVLGYNGPTYLLENETFHTNCLLPVSCSTIESQCNVNLLTIVHCPESEGPCLLQNTTMITNSTISLVKTNLSVKDTGAYFCRFNDSWTDSFSLWIGYRPIGPVNITCISIEANNLTCSWEKSAEDKNNPLPVRYRSSFIGSPLYGHFDCPHPGPSARTRDDRTCSIAPGSSSTDNQTFLPFNSYILYINASNAASSHVTYFPIKIERIVKLLPPQLSVLSIEPRAVTLMLNQSSPLPLIVVEKIIYQITISWDDYNRNVTHISDQNYSKLPILDLVPYTTYLISVRNRAINASGDIYWSRPVTQTITTQAAVPVSVPDIIGYSSEDDYVSIYLKPIPFSDKFGMNTSYEVSLESHLIGTFSWDTVTIANITQISYTRDQLVVIRTVNEIGQSQSFSQFIIPANNQELSIPKDVIVEQASTSYLVSWNSTNGTNLYTDLTSIMVYSCVGTNKICQNNLTVEKMSSNASESVLTLQRKAEEMLLFAVSYVYRNGYSTEMVFSECKFPSINQAPTGVSDFVIIPKERQLIVKLGEFCSYKYLSRPMKYIIYYNLKSDNNVTACDNTFDQIEVPAYPELQEVVLDNLSSSTSYLICVLVVTKGGRTQSLPTVHQTLSSKQEDIANSNIALIVLPVVIGSVFVVVLLFFVRKLHRKWTKENPSIELPFIKNRETEVKIHVPQTPNDSGIASSKNSNTSSSSKSPINIQYEDENKETEISSNCPEELVQCESSCISNQNTDFNDEEVRQKSDSVDTYTDVSLNSSSSYSSLYDVSNSSESDEDIISTNSTCNSKGSEVNESTDVTNSYDEQCLEKNTESSQNSKESGFTQSSKGSGPTQNNKESGLTQSSNENGSVEEYVAAGYQN